MPLPFIYKINSMLTITRRQPPNCFLVFYPVIFHLEQPHIISHLPVYIYKHIMKTIVIIIRRRIWLLHSLRLLKVWQKNPSQSKIQQGFFHRNVLRCLNNYVSKLINTITNFNTIKILFVVIYFDCLNL